MSNQELKSLHLEGQPRRELFRQARERLNACCGTHTVAGDLRLLASEPAAEEPHKTPAAQPGAIPAPQPGAIYQLKAGDTYHPLQVGINSIGRLDDNAIVLRDEHISRRHCAVILHSDGRMELHDIASKNGTLLNGKKIHGPTPIVPGDQITLCGLLLEVVAR